MPWVHPDKRTDGQTDGRYQVHYLPRFAVDNDLVFRKMLCILVNVCTCECSIWSSWSWICNKSLQRALHSRILQWEHLAQSVFIKGQALLKEPKTLEKVEWKELTKNSTVTSLFLWNGWWHIMIMLSHEIFLCWDIYPNLTIQLCAKGHNNNIMISSF